VDWYLVLIWLHTFFLEDVLNLFVDYNGFRFMMNWYNNEELRNIQLSMIESELIQVLVVQEH